MNPLAEAKVTGAAGDRPLCAAVSASGDWRKYRGGDILQADEHEDRATFLPLFSCFLVLGNSMSPTDDSLILKIACQAIAFGMVC